jgi:hypothetical protein
MQITENKGLDLIFDCVGASNFDLVIIFLFYRNNLKELENSRNRL